MGTNTPELDSKDKKEAYLKEHLYYELAWLLRAATEWSVQNQLNLGQDGYSVQVYAMDSAFLHARTLFEFFLRTTGENYYGSDAFGVTGLNSPHYDKWKGPLHRHVMHAQTRSRLEQLESLSGEMKDLNKMPVDFACEIIRLWKEFEEKLLKSNEAEDKDLGQLAQTKIQEASKEARSVVSSKVAQKHAEEKQVVLKPPSFCT